MNPDLHKLQSYPFEKLAALKQGIEPADLPHIALSIGEPRHPTPAVITDTLIEQLSGLASYPTTRGIPALRQAIANWLQQRFALPDGLLDADQHVLPVNGTREALFSFAQAVIDRSRPAKVLMPNPFYQIYEGAALLAGAEPVLMDCLPENDYLPDFDAVDEQTWQQCQLVYVCSPGNPTGAVMPQSQLEQLIHLSDRYNFVIASDECYSEIYFDEQQPPPGLLQAAIAMGRDDLRNCVVFHSLSKRSNAPGLRSGFVAGDASVLARYFSYRTYQGCAMPLQHQHASIAAWQDETHVQHNRRLYREKFAAVIAELEPVLAVRQPDAAFYLWLQTPIDDETFTRELYRTQNVTVLPGRYLSRDSQATNHSGNHSGNQNGNPGRNHVRMALVAEPDECLEAAQRLRLFSQTL